MFVPAPTPAVKKKSDGSHRHKLTNSGSVEHHHGEGGPVAAGRSGSTFSSNNNNNNGPPSATDTATPSSFSYSQQLPPPLAQGGGGGEVNSPSRSYIPASPPFVIDSNNQSMFAAMSTAFQNTSTSYTRQTLKPLFHITASDATVVALEHNLHFNATAFAVSNGEVYVTALSCEGTLSGRGGSGTNSAAAAQDASLAGVALQRVGKVPGGCSQLSWAPWAAGMLLVCCCPGKCVVVFSHVGNGEWAEELVEVQECLSASFSWLTGVSAPLTLVCACTKGKVAICQRREGFGAWTDATYFTISTAEDTAQSPVGTAAMTGNNMSMSRTGKRNSGKDLLVVSVAENGSLVALGDQDGLLRLFELNFDNKQASLTLVYTLPPALGMSSSRTGGAMATTAPSVNSNSTTSPSSSSSSALRALEWAPTNGRSFWMLAFATCNEIGVLLLPNAIFTLLEGTAPSGGSSSSGLTNVMSGASFSFPQRRLGYRRLEINDADILKVSWSPMGTRLTTSHSDGTARIFAVNITHRDVRVRGGGVMTANASVSATTAVDPSLSGVIPDVFNVEFVEVSRAVAPFATDAATLRRST